MKMKLKLILPLLLIFNLLYSQNNPQNLHDIQKSSRLLEDKNGHLIQNLEQQKQFLEIREEKRKKEILNLKTENQNLKKGNLNLKTETTQQAVEMCSNGGFEQYETISGSSYLKNFLYTIGDPPGPTQCQSITNTADSYINRYNPNNMDIMATGVSADLVDPYMGDIKAFDQYALKINYENSSTYGSIVQGKRFKTNNENYLKFNYKAVLQTVYDNSHTDNQPFVKARILDKNGVVVNEFCLVGDEKNCIFTKVPNQTSYYVTLYTANWQSGLLDISSIPNNEEFTVEFMASRCGLGGHFGYMYVDDICLLHSDENLKGSIELDPLNKVCPSLPFSVCGSYTIPNSGGITATVKKITLNLYDSTNVSVYSTSTTSSIDTTNKKFCFTLNATNFPNSINANYNVGVQVDYDISGTSCTGTTFNSAIDPDANPGWDISFLNCTANCAINVTTAKISQCDANHDGSENFDLSTLNSLVVTSTTGLSFSYYKNYNDAEANLNAITNFTSYLSSSTSIFVRVSKDSSCYKIISASLEVRNPTTNITGILNVCSGSTVLTAYSGSSYLWSTGDTSQSITVTSIGNYSVTVTDSFGCSSDASVTIEPSQTAVSPILQVTQPSCFVSTGSIKVTSPASQYSFDDGTTWSANDTMSNLYPGTYLVKIKTINGCTSYSQSTTITSASTLYPNYYYTNPLFCGDVGSITITTPSSYYSFDDGITWVNYSTATNLSPGNYKIRTKDLQGCISSANNVLISSNTLETPTYTLIQPACSVTGSITINTISDFYTFDGGTTWVTSNIMNNLSSGSYSLGIKNALGCTSYYTYVYLNDFQYSYPEYTIEQPVCGSNGSITITTVSDFYSFDNGVTWTTNNAATNLPFGSYQIKVKNSAGCISSVSYAYLYEPHLYTPIISIEQPTCGANGKITINSLSDFYSFDNGTTWTTLNYKSLPPGSYSIIIKNSIDCTSYPTGVYLNNPNIAAPIYTVIQPTCTTAGSITINTVADFYSFDGGYNWGTSPTLSNINSYGYYSISIKNSVGCVSNNIGISINDPSLPDPDYTFTNPSCGNIGNITFNTTADYYSIDYGTNWSTNNVFNNLSSGNYYVMIKKANCASKYIPIYLDSSNLAQPKYTIVQPTCGTKGSITINTTADLYSIDGQTWGTSPIFSNLPPGYYYPTIKNAQGCISNSNYAAIQTFYLPVPTFTSTQPTCGNGGSITFTTTASQYSIDGGNTWSTNPTFTNLNSNSYYLSVKNASGCTSYPYSTYVTLYQYYLPNPDFTLVQPSCGTNGNITIATVATSYSFDNGTTWTTNPKLTGLTSGYYYIMIKNASGCQSNGLLIYITPYYLSNPNVKVVQPTCGNGGSITITTPADKYSFDGGTTWTTNPILLDPASTSYNITIKNTSGCVSQSQYFYINKFYLSAPNVTSIQPTCSSPSGTIIINTTADQYSFDGGITWTTNPIKKNLAGGSYNIVIKNTLGCISSGSYLYIYPPPAIPAAPAVLVTQPSTCGATDGSITITTPAMSYSFNDGNSWTTNPKKINVGAGTYIIKIKTNSYTCESSTMIVNLSSGTTIAAPAYIATQPNCSSTKGSITITTSAATYSYDDGLTYVFSNTKTDLSPGIYFIKIKNLSGCISDAATVTISTLSALPAPTYEATQPNCTNLTGALTIKTIADYYSFDNGITFETSNTKSNLSAGTYNLMIKYNSGCISLSTPVTIDSAPIIPAAPQVVVTNPIGCSSSTGSIMVSTVANLYSFDDGTTWNTSNTATLSPGIYLIRIKYTNGCPSIAYAATINTPPNAPSTPTLAVFQPKSCSNPYGSISITNSAYQYSFDNGVNYSSNPISGNLAVGTYLVRTKNSSGCESVALSTTIIAPTDYPSNPAFTTIQPDCNNLKGAITITETASEYSFDNGVTWITNTTQSNLAPGTYYLKVKNSNGCISNATPVIIIPFTNFTPKPTLTNPQTFCIQQNATLGSIVIIGQNIKWYDNLTNGSLLTNSTLLQNGITYYSSQTINGCESLRTPILINIQNTPAPTGNYTQSFCTGQNPTLNNLVVSGTSIKWYDNSIGGNILANTTPLQDGVTYYATQKVNGCESLNTLRISVTLITSLPAKNFAESFCDDLNDGTETVDLTRYNTAIISNNTIYNFSYFNSISGAQNETAANKINNVTNYKLVLGDNKIYVRVNSNTPCFAVAELNLTLISKPIITIQDIVPLCENKSIIVDAGSGFNSYLWSNGASTQTITIVNPGDYSVTVTKNYATISCLSTKKFIVKKSNIATITSLEIQDWTDNQNSIIAYVTGNGDYEYSIDGINYQTSNQFTGLIGGDYTVQVRDKNGCGTATDEIYLLMYPKFFTPNGDGYNDTWKIKFSELEAGLTIKIFDRYGKFIKDIDSNDASWNGTYNGFELPSTDYWFVVTRANGKEYKGHFSLKR